MVQKVTIPNSIVEQIPLPSIKKGVIFDAKPHFIAPSKGYIPEKPGFYIRNSDSGDVYIGYLNNLHPAEMPSNVSKNLRVCNKEYKMIIRGVGERKNFNGFGHLILEERLEPEDAIHFQVERVNSPQRFFGRFLKYGVFVNNTPVIKDREVKKGDYIFGKVERITGEHRFVDLKPVSIVSESRYQKWKNRVIRKEEG